MRFQYLEPTEIDEAVSLLVKHSVNARLLAGGTDLIVQMRRKSVRPEFVIDMKRISGLDNISQKEGNGIRIGALTKIRGIVTSPIIREGYPVVSQAAAKLGCVAIRNVATIGGNICNASPSADMLPALIGLSAVVRIVGPSGERSLRLEEFFMGPGITVLEQGEILTEIYVPEMQPRTGTVYIKHRIRKALDLAVVGVAAVIPLSPDGSVRDPRITLGAVGPTPLRARGAEAVLADKIPDRAMIDQCAETATKEISPITDARASAEYRKKMVRVFTRHAVEQALTIAGKA